MSVAQHKLIELLRFFLEFLNAADGLELDLNSFLHSN